MEGHFPYLTTEYARNKMIEQYDREAEAREREEHAEIHRECDEYRITHGQEPVSAEDFALKTITEINERYLKINGLKEVT